MNVRVGKAQFRDRWLTLRAEVMGARDGVLRRLGYYGARRRRPTPDVELVGRWDYWDPDLHNETGAVDVAEREIVAGASYFIEGGATRARRQRRPLHLPERYRASSTLLLFSLQSCW